MEAVVANFHVIPDICRGNKKGRCYIGDSQRPSLHSNREAPECRVCYKLNCLCRLAWCR